MEKFSHLSTVIILLITAAGSSISNKILGVTGI
jgi:hypothetical protein